MTPYQIKMARHALGLPNSRHRSYRNRYYAAADTECEKAWDDLVLKGLAGREAAGPGKVFFCLTEAGALQALDPAETLDAEDFPPPESLHE